MEFRASATINAEADRIWAILTDAPGYPAWDPGVERIEGRIAAGQKITAYTKRDPKRPFPAIVSVFEPGRRMVWRGGLPLGLFTGVRTFALEPAGDGATRFALSEVFSGPLLPLFRRSIPDLTPTFEAFAAGLKARAERAD